VGSGPQRARTAAEASRNAEGDEGSRLELLLGDIRTAFSDKGTKMPDMFGAEQVIISSAKLVKVLIAIEGRPWAEMGKSSKPLTQNRLARMLKPLGVIPEKVGPRDNRVSGYVRAHFVDAFERYLLPEGASEPDTRTPSDEMGTSGCEMRETQ
jgi:Protein of unknown function (DUF3631)